MPPNGPFPERKYSYVTSLTDTAGDPHIPAASDPARDGLPGDCGACPFSQGELCRTVIGSDAENRVSKVGGSIRPRQHIYKSGESRGQIVVLRDGWAIRFVLTPDGRRQILSILLPGDIAGGEFLMREEARVSVQALATPLKYCAFDIADLKEFAKKDPSLIWTFVGIEIAEHEASEALMVGLGRRNAEQRIARLVLDIYERLEKRGLADGNTIPFVLRQKTIADLLGLTQVHVSRVMTAMKTQGIMQLARGSLTILDMRALRAAA